MDIVELLDLRGLDCKRRIKLVRHQDSRYDVHDLLRRGWLEAYQSYQSRGVFDDCEFVVSFVGLGGTRARLVGVYQKLSSRSGHDAPLPPGCPYTEWAGEQYYELKRLPGFEDLEHRVVIEWGKGALAWHQWISPKEVVEVLPRGQFRPPFRDYLEFDLTYAELVDLYAHEDANREWRARLSAVAGVYLILATTTGAQYVGSASGTTGIWGRWASYARDGHGGNQMLKQLIDIDEAKAYPESFSYSILQILPRTLARSEVLRWESRYKEKLGTRAVGLNAREARRSLEPTHAEDERDENPDATGHF